MIGPVNVKSEIGRLRRVMLHRPGAELGNLMPDYLERMLAEDTPDVRRAGEEHDVFANILRGNGVDVVYIEDMFRDVVKDETIRNAFIDDFVELGVPGVSLKAAVREYLRTVPYDKLFDAVAKGITRKDLDIVEHKPIQYYVKEDYPFLTDPLPNLYFTRDISFSLGTGIAISAMCMPARMRETLFIRYIHKYSEVFGKGSVDLLYDYNCGDGIEGGDVLSLSDKCVAIGSGERTTVPAVERLAKTLFARGYEKVLLFKNPNTRTYMHLDVLMTHIDHDKFLAHPCIAHKWFDVYELTPAGHGELNVSLTTDPVERVLERALGIDKVSFVEVAGGDPIQYRREHWNMGANSLAMAPGNIITYDRNVITNELIDKAGVKVNPIPGGELSRGRGGPRCMSMPILRDDIR
ncbi:MAG: arginine deiminase [Clostridia bacterium]|nr:arginine deiminase [Clostridia bacterium]